MLHPADAQHWNISTASVVGWEHGWISRAPWWEVDCIDCDTIPCVCRRCFICTTQIFNDPVICRDCYNVQRYLSTRWINLIRRTPSYWPLIGEHCCQNPWCPDPDLEWLIWLGGRQVPNRLTLDHIVPVYRGGMNFIWNLQWMCTRCNNLKRDRPMPVFVAAEGRRVLDEARRRSDCPAAASPDRTQGNLAVPGPAGQD